MTSIAGASRLLSFARVLQRAATFAELLDIAREEVTATTGYRHAWLMVADREQADELRLIEVSGDQRAVAWDVAPVLKVAGDAFLEELVASDAPVVIHDARTDRRTNKALVEKLQNRTLINIPLRLLDKPFGILGTGTFGDEGCRSPTAEELEYLMGMASQLAVAAGRIRFIESNARAEREKRDLEHRMMQIQKLESLGLLAGGIAHDFNNLLTVMISGLALALERITDTELAAELDVVMGAANRASNLTKQLLVMSRSQELDLRSVDVNARLVQLLSLLKRLLPATIEIDLIQAARLPLVRADAVQLDQIFMNLCINARDAMPGGGKLTIESENVLINGSYVAAHPWAKAGRYVLVTVTDNGTGMAGEVLNRAFEPFFSTKGREGGTGLGLSVVYGIVRQHGGMVHCYSEVGTGTSFKVYLPALEHFANEVGTKLASVVPTGTESILVAEDDEQVRAVVLRILRRAGYTVTAVPNGDEACRVVEQQTFDLVILDVVMPGTPCPEVVVRLKALRPDLSILLSSGYTAGALVTDPRSGNPLDMLSKPYDPDKLLRGVRAMMDRGRL